MTMTLTASEDHDDDDRRDARGDEGGKRGEREREGEKEMKGGLMSAVRPCCSDSRGRVTAAVVPFIIRYARIARMHRM